MDLNFLSGQQKYIHGLKYLIGNITCGQLVGKRNRIKHFMIKNLYGQDINTLDAVNNFFIKFGAYIGKQTI